MDTTGNPVHVCPIKWDCNPAMTLARGRGLSNIMCSKLSQFYAMYIEIFVHTPSILDRIPLDPCFLTLIAWK